MAGRPRRGVGRHRARGPERRGDAALALYLVLRIGGHGRPEGHLQHWLQWRVRQAQAGGRLSAAARARTLRLPFGPYDWRDEPREGRP